jgi:ribosomal protein S18 acetylase RimI-like enzyme
MSDPAQNSQPLPQLFMEKDDLDRVPDVQLADGYHLRTFRPGDEAGMGRLYEMGELGQTTADQVRGFMLDHPCYRPERIFVVEHDGELVGTAAAWAPPEDPGVGYLHMISVSPEHRGQRIGLALTAACIRYSHQEGFKVQRLSTDDSRESAIRLYHGLGYYPTFTHESHPGRWKAVAEKMGLPELLQRAVKRF